MSNNTFKSLAEELRANALEYNENAVIELNHEELKLVDDIREHMVRISKKGRLECLYSVGRTSGYNIRKINFEKIKQYLEGEEFGLHVDISRYRTSFDVVVLKISAEGLASTPDENITFIINDDDCSCRKEND